MKKNTKQVKRTASGIEDLEARRMMAANFDTGININVNTSDVREKGIPVMKALGVDSVRVFISPEFDKRSFEPALQRAIEYGAAGFDVMLVVTPEAGKVYSASQVKSWFQWAVGNSSLRNAVDRWQVGNEVDSAHYWKGSLSSYVTNMLKPASEAIRAAGESVVSGSVSWNPQDVKEMISYGMLNYSDYVGYHPYANGLSALKQRVQEINDIVAGRRPIVASEWNVRGYENNKTAWAAAVKDAYPVIRNGFDINYYFALLNTTATLAGPGGIMNSNGSKTGFFSALMKGKGGSNGGSDPSARPSVAKISVYNDDTGLLLLDSLKSGDVIDLSETTTRNLSFVAVTAAGTSSVKITLDDKTVTDNSATFELVQSMYAGSYTLSATPYSADNAGGTKGSTRTFSFSVKNSPTNVGTPAPGPGTTTGKITGVAFNDTNKNGVLDSGETKTSGKKIFLDTNNNGKLDSGEKSTTSGSGGAFSFTGLAAGTYHVRRVFPSGYTYSNSPINVTLTKGQTFSSANVGSKPGNASSPTPTPTLGKITGVAFNDTNKNGVLDSGETKTSGKKVFLDTNNNGKLDSGEKSTTTGSGGAFSFTGLAAGTYHVRRVFPSGYTYSNAPIDVALQQGQTLAAANLGSKPGKASSAPSTGTGKPAVTSMSLVDAKTGKVLPGYENLTGSKWVKLSSLPTRNVRVVFNANGDTSSVKIAAVGKTKVDNDSSFQSDSFYAWSGTYMFTGTPYAKDNAAGTVGNKLTVTIKFY